ncbi:nuclear pore membrane glycoprotein 210 isoform X1 [Hydra vulgaris]|uniref:nuclear pore membrane glycoprotein 210 isoform X1 n=1 Tax=Hydra vulgaris TaxID=6087 RepID=UPI001F5F0B72|nr:nuclear pore membrane glycoprotein 210-like isoform X1 [Hydra vulgaris]
MACLMAGRWILISFILTNLQNFVFSQHENTLNVPQVLLPFATKESKPTTFVLKAYKGCFRWTSTKPNIASVLSINDKINTSTPEDEDNLCSQSALVTVELKTPNEDSTVILAEENGTGLTLRCNVFVDTIHKIEIATTTRELLLGESPEVFEVYAYDKEGNLFSSLGSQKFEWSFLPASTNQQVDPRLILKLLWFQDSSYDTTKEIYSLEEQHYRGCSALVEGIRTGEAIVSARLSDLEYKNVKPTSVKLTVLDNVMLYPSNVYILVNQVVKFNALQLRRGKKNDIILPSAQYTVQVLDDSVAHLNDESASVTGMKIGQTKVQLIDNNMLEAYSIRLPTALVHVVDPGKIGFAINPGKLWLLQVGKVYELLVLLFDDDGNSIQITNNTMIESMLSNEYFEVLSKSNNGSYFYVRANMVGKTVMTAKLLGIQQDLKDLIRTKNVYGEQVIEIYDPIVVTPEIVVFPWDPEHGQPYYRFQLMAKGGSGVYSWSSMNKTVVSVNSRGLISTENLIGEILVKARDVRNPLHFGASLIKILQPEEIVFLDTVVEVEVGKILVMPLSIFAFSQDREKFSFTDCRKIMLKTTFSDPSVFKLADIQSENLPSQGCTTISLEAIKVGYSTVTTSYVYADVVLRAVVVVASYYPIKIVDPIETAVVVIGSTKRIVATGGPLPWILDPSQYFEVISAEEDEWVAIKEKVPERDLTINYHYFDVKCLQIGEQILNIEVGNKITTKNRFPEKSSASTRFLCSPPATLRLLPSIVFPTIDMKTRTLESCLDEHKRIPVRNNRELRIDVQVYSTNGIIFDDFSSLDINWSIDNTDAATLSTKETKFELVLFDFDKKQSGRTHAFQIVTLHSKAVPVAVTATILGYRHSEIQFKVAIAARLPLVLVPEPSLSLNWLTIFAHPSNQVNLKVSGGTNVFIVKSNNPHLAKLNYIPPHSIQVTPNEEGKLIIYLHDACLDAEMPAEARLLLSDVYALQLSVSDKVELDQKITAKCQALDMDGNILNVADISTKLNLQLKLTADILNIENTKRVSGYEAEAIYNITGKSVGITSLTCEAMKSNGNMLSSKTNEVQVFSAIELQPKYLKLLVGSQFQVNSAGGPRPNAVTFFSLDNTTVADVSQNGLVYSKVVGKTTLTGMSRGFDTSGKDVVYSQDQTFITVFQIKGFKILLGSHYLVTNSEVGILSIGINDEGPFTFATSQPYLRFHWSTSNHKIAVVESVHKNAGVSIAQDNDFRAVIHTFSPGLVTIKLHVEVVKNDFYQVNEHAQLEDEIQIQVIQKLEILYPPNSELLLPHNTKGVMKTNRDPLPITSYSIVNSCTDHHQNLVQVSSGGYVTSFALSGTAIILITVHEDFGYNQTIFVKVEVKPVSTVSLHLLSNFVISNSQRPAFPIGSNVLYSVQLHDNIARKFDIATIPLKHRVSRSDIVHVIPNPENATFLLRTISIGEVIMKVWDDDNPSLSDYIRIRVTEGIIPAKVQITLGNVFCFHSNIIVDKGWWSTSSGLLSIDRVTGAVVGVNTGTAMVYYNDDSFSTYAEVTVVQPNSAPLIVDESYLFLSNDMVRYFRISFDNDATNSHSCSENLSIDVQAPFKCNAKWTDSTDNIEEVFGIKSVYKNGQPHCMFSPHVLTPALMKSLSISDRTIVLNVDISDGRHMYSSKPLEVRFAPEVYIIPKEIFFSNKNKVEIIEVYGSQSQLSGLKIKNIPPFINVERLTTVDPYLFKYELSLKSSIKSDANTSVTFFSPLSASSSSVLVHVKGEFDNKYITYSSEIQTSWNRKISEYIQQTNVWVVSYTVILATIILLIVLYHYFIKERYGSAIMPPSYSNSPYIQTSPPPYQYSPTFQTKTPVSYGPTKKSTPQRHLFSVSQ